MPTYDKNNPLTFPVRIFDALTIGVDKDGNETHTGTYVEFTRAATDPKPLTIDDALALAKKKCPKEVATIFDKPRTGTKAQQAIATLREVAADPKGAALALKDATGTVVVKDDVKPRVGPAPKEPIK